MAVLAVLTVVAVVAIFSVMTVEASRECGVSQEYHFVRGPG